MTYTYSSLQFIMNFNLLDGCPGCWDVSFSPGSFSELSAILEASGGNRLWPHLL